MNNYIESVCIGRPLSLPEYDETAEQWVLYFEESETPWFPYEMPRDIIGYHCVNVEEATDLYNYYNQNPIKEEELSEEVTA